MSKAVVMRLFIAVFGLRRRHLKTASPERRSAIFRTEPRKPREVSSIGDGSDQFQSELLICRSAIRTKNNIGVVRGAGIFYFHQSAVTNVF